MTSRIILPNGLRVVHSHMPDTAMVAVNLGYAAGARNESPELTGIAHLMEHMMFGGSEHVPDFDKVLQAAGGSSNAWTSDDFTFYHDILPARNIETAFYLESDRMASPLFSEEALAVQKGVVTEEFKQQCLNRPYGDLGHRLREMLYHTHPYKIPVIGKEPAHVMKATRDDLFRFFRKNYSPANAVLAVCGNIGAERVFELAEKWFSDIKSVPVSPFVTPDDPYPAEEQWREVEGNVPATRIVVAWRIGPRCAPDALAGDILTDLLANGRSSRLQLMLNDPESPLVSADACVSGHEDSGYILLTGQPRDEDDTTVRTAAETLIAQARRLAGHGDITAHEVERALNRFRSQMSMRRMSYAELVQQLTFEEFRHEDYAEHLRLRSAFTPAMLEAEAGAIFSRPVSVLLYRPKR